MARFVGYKDLKELLSLSSERKRDGGLTLVNGVTTAVGTASASSIVAQNTTRRRITLVNRTADSVAFIGPADVGTADGFPLPGEVATSFTTPADGEGTFGKYAPAFVMVLETKAAIYAISDTDDTEIRCLEEKD